MGADLGGIEQAVQHLTTALAARGHEVRLDTPPPSGVEIVVAVNDARLLARRAGLPVIWFHNEVALWRELRRGRAPALWRHRPVAVFCGTIQARRASPYLPLRQRVVVPHGLPDAILRAAPAVLPPGAEVIYISQAYRGLADIIALWRSRVAPENPAASFRAYIAAEDVGRFRALAGGAPSIRIFPRVANDEIPSLLRGARLLVAPGHSSETFCLSAAEAVAMGVPVVTLGRGALSERVVHGKTGFICRDYPDMASRTLALLSDDALWLRMNAACLATRAEAGWDHVASLWEATLLSGERGGN